MASSSGLALRSSVVLLKLSLERYPSYHLAWERYSCA